MDPHPEHPDDREVVVTALPDPLAQVVAGAIAAEGIVVRCERDGTGAVYGLNTGAFATRVLVRAPDVERARALLAEAEAGEG